MNKQELISQLNNAQNNFMLGIAALGLLMQEESYPVLEKLLCILTDTSFCFVSDVADVHHHFQNTQFPIKYSSYPLTKAANQIKTVDESQRQNIQQEFFKMLLRVFLKESFEAIKDYCKKSNNLLNDFKKQDWYDFARIIRNCLSHDGLIQYNSSDKKRLPISWKENSLTLNMEGLPLSVSFLGIDVAIALCQEMRTFVENSP